MAMSDLDGLPTDSKLRHTIQERFRRKVMSLAVRKPDHPAHETWAQLSTRGERNRFIAAWNNVGGNWDRVITQFRRLKTEQLIDTHGMKGEYVCAEELATKISKSRADVFVKNCRKAARIWPELVKFDRMLECDTFLFSRQVVEALSQSICGHTESDVTDPHSEGEHELAAIMNTDEDTNTEPGAGCPVVEDLARTNTEDTNTEPASECPVIEDRAAKRRRKAHIRFADKLRDFLRDAPEGFDVIDAVRNMKPSGAAGTKNVDNYQQTLARTKQTMCVYIYIYIYI
jgi:hypothetical protein